MEDLNFQHRARKPAGGTRQTAIIGVVASGNLEVLVERVLPDAECRLEIKTAAVGFGESINFRRWRYGHFFRPFCPKFEHERHYAQGMHHMEGKSFTHP